VTRCAAEIHFLRQDRVGGGSLIVPLQPPNVMLPAFWVQGDASCFMPWPVKDANYRAFMHGAGETLQLWAFMCSPTFGALPNTVASSSRNNHFDETHQLLQKENSTKRNAVQCRKKRQAKSRANMIKDKVAQNIMQNEENGNRESANSSSTGSSEGTHHVPFPVSGGLLTGPLLRCCG